MAVNWNLNHLGDLCKEIAKRRGFYDGPISYDALEAQFTSEAIEAREEYEKGNKEAFEKEWIDKIFVLLSQGRYLGIDLDAVAQKKLEFNSKRSDRYVR